MAFHLSRAIIFNEIHGLPFDVLCRMWNSIVPVPYLFFFLFSISKNDLQVKTI